jgi:flavin reductase (DIM6/NTAB) family NADH-FMN oxidoreductase RutF
MREEDKNMQIEGLQIDPLTYRKALGHFASGITVITTVHEGVIHGMTANAFCSVSLNPPLVMISIDQQSRMHTLLAQSGFYGVSVLGRNQEAFSRHFAGRPQGGLQIPFIWREECPLLEGALVHLVCQVCDAHPAGDHTLYIGLVKYLDYSDEHAPLLFYSGKYQVLEEQSARYPAYLYDPSLW